MLTLGRVATIQGSFDHYLACTGTPQEWSATVQPYSGRFAGGKATLSYGFWASNEWGSGGGSDTRTVQLRAK